jgi:hypothetical protein
MRKNSTVPKSTAALLFTGAVWSKGPHTQEFVRSRSGRRIRHLALDAKGLHEAAFDESLRAFALSGEEKFAHDLDRTRAILGYRRARLQMARKNLARLQKNSKHEYVPAIEFAGPRGLGQGSGVAEEIL